MMLTCNGVAFIVVNDHGEAKIFARPGNGSHDILLHELVPVELHNNYIKVELIYPGSLRLDAPDKECKDAALVTGFVEQTDLGVLRIKADIAEKIYSFLAANPDHWKYPKNLMQEADLCGADLSKADLSKANLRWADLSGANLRWADLSKADLSEANLKWADLSEANLRGIIFSKLTISGLKFALNLGSALLSDELRKLLGM